MKLIIIFLLALTGCDKLSNNDASPTGKQSVILATVNNTTITEDDLHIIGLRTLGDKYKANMNIDIKNKLLESAIKSRAMAIVSEQETPKARLNQIELATSAYREELLAKEYLRKHARPKPLTSVKLQRYYNEHPELFGGEMIKKVAYIRKAIKNNAKQASKIMDDLRGRKQWDKSQLAKNDIDLKEFNYRKGLLTSQQENIVNRLDEGQTSDLHLLDNYYYVFRVIDIKTLKPKPLSEVAGKVREYMLPQLIAESVSQVSDELMKKVTIKRITPLN